LDAAGRVAACVFICFRKPTADPELETLADDQIGTSLIVRYIEQAI
jgi:hypothetical protein